MTKQIISCMGVVTYIQNKQIFVAMLKDKDDNWVLPKGHFIEGETFVQTAIREVLEETQIKLKKENLVEELGEFNYFSDIENTDKNIKVYLFKINELQKIIPLEKENFIEGKWLPIKKAVNKATYQEQKEVLEKTQTILNRS